MATIYECDKCGNQGKDLKLLNLQLPPSGLNYIDWHDPTNVHLKTHELCSKCVKRLSDWLKPDPKAEGVARG